MKGGIILESCMQINENMKPSDLSASGGLVQKSSNQIVRFKENDYL